jgi:hypothetical protein
VVEVQIGCVWTLGLSSDEQVCGSDKHNINVGGFATELDCSFDEQAHRWDVHVLDESLYDRDVDVEDLLVRNRVLEDQVK